MATSYQEAAHIRSVLRAVQLLKLLGQREEGAPLTELARSLGLPKSSVYRLLATLREESWVTVDEGTGNYKLGLGLLEVSASALASLRLRDVAKPHLEAIWRETGETVHLGVLHRNQVMYAMKYESVHSIRMYSKVGKTAPLYCTGVGKALLAWMEPKQRERILESLELRAYTPNTLASREQLEADLARSLERGYTIDNAEHEEFLRCVGGAILGSDGPVGAISVAAPLFRMPDERVEEVGRLVREHCAALSREIRGVL